MAPAKRTLLARLHLPWLVALTLLAGSASASAAVEISFNSRGLGARFPHAFVVLSGTVDSTGERVETNYGFTVRHLLGPSVLLGSVEGEVASEGDAYVAAGHRHFALVLSDAEYRRVMGVIARWQALPQPSYHLDRRNCVTFVAEIAASLGLQAVPDSATRRRPQAFLDRVARANGAIITARARTRSLAAR
jgi:hypothetical protein